MRSKMLKIARWALLGIFLLVAIWWLKPFGKTVDFAGVVQDVRVENGVVYVMAMQDLSEFTVEIAIPANARVKTAAGPYRAAEFRPGDKVIVNFRKKPKMVNSVWCASPKGTVTVYPAMIKPGD